MPDDKSVGDIYAQAFARELQQDPFYATGAAIASPVSQQALAQMDPVERIALQFGQGLVGGLLGGYGRGRAEEKFLDQFNEGAGSFYRENFGDSPYVGLLDNPGTVGLGVDLLNAQFQANQQQSREQALLRAKHSNELELAQMNQKSDLLQALFGNPTVANKLANNPKFLSAVTGIDLGGQSAGAGLRSTAFVDPTPQSGAAPGTIGNELGTQGLQVPSLNQVGSKAYQETLDLTGDPQAARSAMTRAQDLKINDTELINKQLAEEGPKLENLRSVRDKMNAALTKLDNAGGATGGWAGLNSAVDKYLYAPAGSTDAKARTEAYGVISNVKNDILRAAKIVGSGSQDQREFQQKLESGPSLNKTMDANRLIADMFGVVADRAEDKAAFMREFENRFGHKSGANEYWNEFMNRPENRFFDESGKLKRGRVNWRSIFGGGSPAAAPSAGPQDQREFEQTGGFNGIKGLPSDRAQRLEMYNKAKRMGLIK
jgi:hypothetical protein